jgi:hypothetical protein
MECHSTPLQSLGFVALILIGGGVLWYARDAPGLVGVVMWAGMPLLAMAGYFGLRESFRRGPTLIVSDAGLDDRRLNVGMIPWKDISSVSISYVRSTAFLQIWLRDEAAYVSRWPRWRRAFVPFAKAMGNSPFNSNFSFLTPGIASVSAYIKTFVQVAGNV